MLRYLNNYNGQFLPSQTSPFAVSDKINTYLQQEQWLIGYKFQRVHLHQRAP